MRILQRYRFDEYFNEGEGVVADDEGEFVKFSDIMDGNFNPTNNASAKCPHCGGELIISVTSHVA